MKREVLTLFSVLLVSVVVLIAGAGCRQADVERTDAGDTAEPETTASTNERAEAGTTAREQGGAVARAGAGNAVAKAGGAEARAGDGEARAGDAVAGGGAAGVEGRVEGGGLPGKVVLKVGGEPGTRFGGACVVGGEEKEVSGRVPARFVYAPDGRKVECELQAIGSGPLEVSVVAGGGDRRQEVEVTGDALDFEYSGGGVSYSATSGSGSVRQETRITGSSGDVSSYSGSR